MDKPEVESDLPSMMLGEWVPVLVRLSDYSAVTQFIAAREAERAIKVVRRHWPAMRS